MQTTSYFAKYRHGSLHKTLYYITDMSYTKNVAVIREIKEGFSAGAGGLSGIIKAEKYSALLKIEVNLINFAPLSEGRYVAAVTDGRKTELVENCLFEGKSELDTSAGFAAAVFFVNGGVQLIASAVCGNFQAEVFGLKAEVEKAENVRADSLPSGEESPPESAKTSAPPEKYEDEAIAEVNYYELAQSDESRGAVREDEEKEKNGSKPPEDEEDFGALEEGLARGNFYAKVKPEAERVLSSYPRCEELERAVEGSRFAKIDYGNGRFYIFGVIYSRGEPKYLCYGLPAQSSENPPESLRGISSFLPVKSPWGEGFWMTYQDAGTGAPVEAFTG